ncbi:MAG: uroporphyrinogen-III C-methyltransferase [Candidatus Omnitrophica bacterium]|nr:uroporphyrinogen-III C-methyltransferase [Candidatus Omnitrophota bacterium]
MTCRNKRGRVHLIGAGPGDPELITLKGLRLLKEADVVLYDHLVPKALLQRSKHSARFVPVGKRHGAHSMSQDAINELLFREAAQGKKVVRLKGGDPYVFGRGGEEILFLKERGIDVDVVPGVSSVIAVPALAGIPLTQRYRAMTMAVASGHVTQDNDPIPVPDADTLVYVMCVSDLDKTVRQILKKRGAGTPCAIIENGSTVQERVFLGTLRDIVKKARDKKLVAPAILVVGEVVKLRRKIVRGKDLERPRER